MDTNRKIAQVGLTFRKSKELSGMLPIVYLVHTSRMSTDLLFFLWL